MTILLRQKPLPQVVRQIVQRDNGAWFDPEDMSTMFQSAAGTTPVTALEQPVGLWLDKSQGLELGPELVTNGDFSNGTAMWTTVAGTTISGGKLIATNATDAVRQTISGLVVGKTYKITFTIDSISRGNARCVFSGSTSPYFTQAGTKTVYQLYLGDPTLYLGGSVPTSSVFDNVSVREIKGNHATQPITASRPTLSARYNLLTKTEDFESAAWSKNNSGTGVIPIVTNNYGVAPDGSNTATRVQLNKGGGTTSSDYSSIFQTAAVISGTNYSGGFWLKTNDETIKTLQLRDDAATIVNKLINASPEWVFIPYAGSATTSSSNTMRIWLLGTQGTSDSADILVWHPQLSIGTTPLPYQRVNTATDYDSVGWPRYLSADGVGDHFVLPYLGLYNNASCSIITSHSSSSQAANGVIVSEASSTDADTKYLPYRQLASGGNVDSNIVADNATVILDSTGAAYSGTKENIIESIIDSGTSIEIYRSGVLLLNEPYTRSAVLTLNNTTLFGSVSTTNTNFLNTKLYGLIITKSNLSARDRSLCETYLKSKVQVRSTV